jgi:hypothetical protein
MHRGQDHPAAGQVLGHHRPNPRAGGVQRAIGSSSSHSGRGLASSRARARRGAGRPTGGAPPGPAGGRGRAPRRAPARGLRPAGPQALEHSSSQAVRVDFRPSWWPTRCRARRATCRPRAVRPRRSDRASAGASGRPRRAAGWSCPPRCARSARHGLAGRERQIQPRKQPPFAPRKGQALMRIVLNIGSRTLARPCALPVSMKVLLENLLRNEDGVGHEADLKAVAAWLEQQGRGRARDQLPPGPRADAGLHRRSRRRRPGRHARRHGRARRRPEPRSTRWSPSTWSSTTR